MQRTNDLLEQLSRLHERQMETIRPTVQDESIRPSRRELEEYFRRSQRMRELERELELAYDEECKKVG